MKGVNIIKGETTAKRYLQVDLEYLREHPEEMEDFMDIMNAELRRDEEEIDWKDLKAELEKR